MARRAIPLLAAMLLAGPAAAQYGVRVSPDQAIALGIPEVVFDDHEVAQEDSPDVYLIEDLGPLPSAAEVTGFAIDGPDALFTLATTTDLGGGVVARPADVVRWDGVVYTLAFDGAAEGLADGVSIDAIGLKNKELLLSFDASVDVPGAIAASRNDVVRFKDGVFQLELDADAAGIGPELDVDAVHFVAASRYLLSFDTGGELGGVTFEDEDILQFNGAVWSLYFDGSVADPDWEGADLDAVYVPEPAAGLGLAAGLLGLAALRHVRRR